MQIRLNHLTSLLAGAAAMYAVASASPASAHISLDRAGTHKSRYGDGEQKVGSCGRLNGKRSTNVYTYEPGQTITVKVNEFVKHPSYFRFAFDNDGDDGFLDPRSIKPIDPTRRCSPLDTQCAKFDQAKKSDFYNNETVLPGLDNLEPHLSNQSKGTYTFQVKLPNIECDNCTLQVIQVMEDTVHGAFYTVHNADGMPADGSLEDIYHQCIDIVLKRKTPATDGGVVDAGGPRPDAGTKPDAGTAPDAGPCPIDENALDELASLEEGGEPESSEGGCSLASSGSSAQSASWMLLALGALVARRRRLKKS